LARCPGVRTLHSHRQVLHVLVQGILLLLAFPNCPCSQSSCHVLARYGPANRYVSGWFRAGRIFTTLAKCNRQALVQRDEVAHRRRWPGDCAPSAAEAFTEEPSRLPPLHLRNTDRIERAVPLGLGPRSILGLQLLARRKAAEVRWKGGIGRSSRSAR
jgi:hypothetical protein